MAAWEKSEVRIFIRPSWRADGTIRNYEGEVELRKGGWVASATAPTFFGVLDTLLECLEEHDDPNIPRRGRAV